MKRFELLRPYKTENLTVGTFNIYDEFRKPLFAAVSLERPWLNNKVNVSCISTGAYLVRLEYSPAFNMMLWEVKDVPGRTEIKFHWTLKVSGLKGCIALGQHMKHLSLMNSKNTIRKFHEVMGDDKEAILMIG